MLAVSTRVRPHVHGMATSFPRTRRRWIAGLLVGGIGLFAGAMYLPVRSDPAVVAYLRPRAVAGEPMAAQLISRESAARIALLGEIHGTAAVQPLDLAVLRAQYVRRGVRRYLAEMDPGQAFVLNRYLAAGDSLLLERVFGFWRRLQLPWANREFQRKLREWRRWHTTLPDSAHVQLVGVDRLQDTTLTLEVLRVVLASGTAARSITHRSLLEILADTTRSPESRVRALGRLDLAIPAGDSAMTAIEPLLAAIRQTVRRLPRETAIADNVRDALRREPTQRFYGLWGLTHVVQGTINADSTWPMMVMAHDPSVQIESWAVLPVEAAIIMPSMSLPRLLRDAGDFTRLRYSLARPPISDVAGVRDMLAAAPPRAAVTAFGFDRAAPTHLWRRLFEMHGLLTLLQPFTVEPRQDGPVLHGVVLLRGGESVHPLEARERAGTMAPVPLSP